MEESLYHGVCVCLPNGLMLWCSVVQIMSCIYKCLWIVMHSLDIHAWLAVTGKIDTFSKLTILCQNLEDKPFFNNMCFWEHFRSYHDSRNYLAFVVSHKRGQRWQPCMADILHQIFGLSRGRPRRNEELHFGRVLLSCRFESNTDARKDLPCLCKLQETEGNSCIYLILIVLKHKLKPF